MNTLPTDLENIIYNIKTHLSYNDVIQEYKKKIQPKIKVYMNNNNIGIAINRFYSAKVNGKKSNSWGYFRLGYEVPLFSCNLNELFCDDDFKYAEGQYEKN